MTECLAVFTVQMCPEEEQKQRSPSGQEHVLQVPLLQVSLSFVQIGFWEKQLLLVMFVTR